MKLLRNFLVLSLLGLSFSCSRKIVGEKTIFIKDSIVIRDTAIIVEKDSASLKALLECDSLGQVRLKELLSYKGEKAKILPPVIKNNIIKIICEVDSFAVYAHLKDRYKEAVINEKEYIQVETNKITLLQGFFIILGKIFAGAIIIIIIVLTLKQKFT